MSIQRPWLARADEPTTALECVRAARKISPQCNSSPVGARPKVAAGASAASHWLKKGGRVVFNMPAAKFDDQGLQSLYFVELLGS